MPRPRVLVADDHVIMTQGLGRLLEGEVEIVATASDGQQLVDRARQHRPDIIVSDVNMPGMSGLDAMRRLKADGLRSKFIFLTLHTDSRLASEAMRAGASGYLLKHAAAEELIEAIHAVMAGHTYLTPLMTRDVLWAIGEQDGVQSPALTPRQLDVLRLIAQGKRMKEIANELDISVRTVETHKQDCYRRSVSKPPLISSSLPSARAWSRAEARLRDFPPRSP
jgi:two-component system, NarL family, response regulator NreC